MSTSRLLVLWDVDHTLIESGGVGGEVFAEAFLAATGTVLESAPDPAGETDLALFHSSADRAGVPVREGVFEVFTRAQAEGYRSRSAELRERGRVLPGVVEALAALAGRADVVQSVLSGNTRAAGVVKLEEFGLAGFFDLEVASFGDGTVERADLPPAAWSRVRARYGEVFVGASTVLVGDTPSDVRCARVNGCRVVGVATGRFGVGELAGADSVFPDLSDTAAVLAQLLAT